MKSVKSKIPNNIRLGINYTSDYEFTSIIVEIELKLKRVLRFTEWVNSDQGL